MRSLKMKKVMCKVSLNVQGVRVHKGDVLKVKRLPLVSKVSANAVFVFMTEEGDQFAMSESKAKLHFASTRKPEVTVPPTRPEGMSVMQYAHLKLDKLAVNHKGKCACPRCGGSGEWSNGRRTGACYLCNRDGEVTELQAMMHHVKMSERSAQGLD
jgi:hypothetical protein